MDTSNTLPSTLDGMNASVGPLTGCQGGNTEHTHSACLCMWELPCVLRSRNNSRTLRGRENKHKTIRLFPPDATSTRVISGVFWDPAVSSGAYLSLRSWLTMWIIHTGCSQNSSDYKNSVLKEQKMASQGTYWYSGQHSYLTGWRLWDWCLPSPKDSNGFAWLGYCTVINSSLGRC